MTGLGWIAAHNIASFTCDLLTSLLYVCALQYDIIGG